MTDGRSSAWPGRLLKIAGVIGLCLVSGIVGGAHLASIDQQLRNGVLARAGQPRDGADAHAFAEKVEDFGAAVGRFNALFTEYP